MFKSLSTLLAALLSLATFDAHAQPIIASYTYINQDEEIVFVESYDSGKTALPAVITVFEKAGYTRRLLSEIPVIKTDTLCKVAIYHESNVQGECYSRREGRRIIVGDNLAYPDANYLKIPGEITQLRNDHRRATKALSQGPTNVLFVPPTF